MSRSTSGGSATMNATPANANPALTKLTAKAPAVSPSSPNVSMLIANLRMLDLDLLPGWPDITTQTFVGKDAQHNQKQRIKCAEWALYHLFKIWDVAETREKLDPFFPPLEPLQSLNLRGALYRSLNELKKNGVLGRDCVLRKSMLDECKGDKFVELIANLSNTVLRRVVQSRNNRSTKVSVAYKLSMASLISAKEQSWLAPLMIAHRSGISTEIQRKKIQGHKYEEMWSTLELKRVQLARRAELCKLESGRKNRESDQTVNLIAIKRQLQDNWTGNPKWLNVLLHGNKNKSPEDGILELPFELAWRTSTSGGFSQLGQGRGDLFQDLKTRASHQQRRLQKWKNLQANIRGDKQQDSKSDVKPQADYAVRVKPIFTQHQSLHIRKVEEKQNEATDFDSSLHDYQRIITEMKEELSRASIIRRGRAPIRARGDLNRFKSNLPQAQSKQLSSCIPERPREVNPLPEDTPTLHDGCMSDEELNPAFTPEPRKHSVHSQSIASPTYHGTSPSTRRTTSSSPPVHAAFSPLLNKGSISIDDSTIDSFNSNNFSLPSLSNMPIEPSNDTASPSPSPYKGSNTIPNLLPVRDEELLADQIISSIAATTPSPVKKKQPRLSLLERTRMSMSMSHTLSFPTSDSILDEDAKEAEEDMDDLPPFPSDPRSFLKPSDLDRRASLLERTRKSMTVLEQQQPIRAAAARRSLAAARKSAARQSLYPVNPFETPSRKQNTITEGDEDDDEDADGDDADQAEEADNAEEGIHNNNTNTNHEGISGDDDAATDSQRRPRARSNSKSHKPSNNKKTSSNKDTVFSDDADYNAVFKSRPRIALSPIGTPDNTGGGRRATGMGMYDDGHMNIDNNVDDVDGENDDDEYEDDWVKAGGL